MLDSDDDMPTSTPSRAPTKKIVAGGSDDEIEEILPSTKPLVSRRRSVLKMTAVTSSVLSLSSRLHSDQYQVTSSRQKPVVTTAAGNSEEPIVLDSPADAIHSVRELSEILEVSPAHHAAAQKTTRARVQAHATGYKPQSNKQGTPGNGRCKGAARTQCII